MFNIEQQFSSSFHFQPNNHRNCIAVKGVLFTSGHSSDVLKAVCLWPDHSLMQGLWNPMHSNTNVINKHVQHISSSGNAVWNQIRSDRIGSDQRKATCKRKGVFLAICAWSRVSTRCEQVNSCATLWKLSFVTTATTCSQWILQKNKILAKINTYK